MSEEVDPEKCRTCAHRTVDPLTWGNECEGCEDSNKWESRARMGEE